MSSTHSRLIRISLGPLVAFIGYLLMNRSGSDESSARMAGIALWMALWWITEAVPLAVTSLLPVFLFPLAGIMSTQSISPLYMNHVLFLFVGGFMIAFAMEKWNLHKRIALRIILFIGSDSGKILLGLMSASFLLSMWISNTATTMMLIPTTMAVIYKLEEVSGEKNQRISVGMLLGIAYASSIGGTATLVGTPPNLIFLSQYTATFPDHEPISFVQWFLFGFPVAVVFLFCAFLVLKKMYVPPAISNSIDNQLLFEQEYGRLGKMSFEEKVITGLFSVMAGLWFFRADIQLGNFILPGWNNLFANPDFFQDGTVAVFIATLLFVVPSKQRKGEMVMDWNTVKKLPYNVILLFGGGFALAKGFTESGLTDWMANQLSVVGTLPILATILVMCTFMTFLTEVTSNMATTQLVLPIFAAIAIGAKINPLYLMIPATFSASFAFMLPVATAPNTIIFGSERVGIKDMVRTGIILNLIGIVIMTLAMMVLGRFIFKIA